MGVLFITATVVGVLAGSLIDSVMDAPDYLVNVAANENQVIIGVLGLLTAAVAIFSIPVMMFPILKKHNEALALEYVGFRIFEAIIFLVDMISSLILITLGQEYVKAGAPDSSYFQALGTVLLAARDWTFVLTPIVFGLGALVFYYLLYQSKLIPRWLSGWGLIGAILVLAFSLLGMFGNSSLIFLALPIAVQKMILAVWLMVKGFNPSAIAS
jgi:hypothetical protein